MAKNKNLDPNSTADIASVFAALALERLTIAIRGPHLMVTLDHAATKNALTDQLMAELNLVLDKALKITALRSVILRGANGAFCAGADLKAAIKRLDEPASSGADPIVEMNSKVGELYLKLNSFPKAVIVVVEGPAFGGGFGMVSCADIVLVGENALFALSETTLGLPPGQIAPYVVSRIGQSNTRRLALSGMRVDAKEAVRIGLADEFCDAASIEARLTEILNLVGKCAPHANTVTKDLILANEPSIENAAQAFAACLRHDEGREGVAAFTAKRPANWVKKV